MPCPIEDVKVEHVRLSNMTGLESLGIRVDMEADRPIMNRQAAPEDSLVARAKFCAQGVAYGL
jgi:hypothetical protein